MKIMHVLSVFLSWWGSFFLFATGRLFMKGNKVSLITLIIISGVIAALMTPLFLMVTDDPSEPPQLQGTK